jgi:hypothetical protein
LLYEQENEKGPDFGAFLSAVVKPVRRFLSNPLARKGYVVFAMLFMTTPLAPITFKLIVICDVNASCYV